MTGEFRRWLNALRDREAYRRINVRLDRLASGNLGLHRVLASGVGELKVDHGPGYRLYFLRKGDALVILLSGGDKSTQQRDIRRAIAMANDLDIDTCQ